VTDPDLLNAAWRKSSYSGGEGGNCIELADLGEGLAVRDSKNPAAGTVAVGPNARAAFLAAVRASAHRG
jgi:hypothetical protein